jgi:acetylornithine/succinyldiaminopimelate/putrescine aminotransferase
LFLIQRWLFYTFIRRLKEVQVVDTGTPLGSQREIFSYSRPYEVLAAKNATLRLRAPSGHVFSFTDLTSAQGAVNFGHLNPGIDPFASLASDLVASFYPPSAASYAQWLLKKLSLTAHTVVYQAGGSAAVRSAIELAQRTRPGKVAVLEGSLHGLGDGCTGEEALRLAPGSAFDAWEDVSCLLYEPIQTAGGYVQLPLPWLRGLSQSAQAAGVLVIADEVQCGFYRFGKLSLAASEFLLPDIYLFGNSMTNGIYPLSALVCPEGLRDALPASEDGWEHTFQTAALGFQAAEAVAGYIDSTDIGAQVAQINLILSQTCEKLAANPCLSAFHLAGPTLSLEVRDARASELVEGCMAHGVLVSAGVGGRRVRVAPPLSIQPDQLTHALKVLKKAAGAL